MLVRADARCLPLCAGSVDCVVTSPPYFGLRDYGSPRQIGLEATPDGYVQVLVEVFREVRRVLTADGTVWLNLGDSYGPNKQLVGTPWRVAFALQADGWLLRADVIWHKPRCMPESVTDRPTRAHEYLFLLAASTDYHYDADAIREPLSDYYLDGLADLNGVKADRPVGMDNFSKERRHTDGISNASTRAARTAFINPAGRNKRSVWTVNPESYQGAHFATMPEKLIEPCVLAGCRPGGLVLDPFVGSGTVVAVAQRLGRRGVGVDLAYQEIAKERTAQLGLRF